MKECIGKMKKEYSAPQMEVMDCAVQSFLCDSAPKEVDVCLGECPED